MKSVGVLTGPQLTVTEHASLLTVLVHQHSSSATITTAFLKSGFVIKIMTVAMVPMR